MRRALFWDFDGTLVFPTNSADDMIAALTDHGYALPPEEVTRHVRAGFSWNWPEESYVDGTGEKWWARLLTHLDVLYAKYDVAMVHRRSINDLFRHRALQPDSYTLYEDAVAALEHCSHAGYTNYILSNNFPGYSRVIEGMGLSGHFEDCIISGDIGYEKPRIELFEYALRVAGQPQIRYMIGDNPVADVQGGRAAGMTTILVHKEGAHGAEYHCRNLSEIPGLL